LAKGTSKYDLAFLLPHILGGALHGVLFCFIIAEHGYYAIGGFYAAAVFTFSIFSTVVTQFIPG
jgi:hypothetical protein